MTDYANLKLVFVTQKICDKTGACKLVLTSSDDHEINILLKSRHNEIHFIKEKRKNLNILEDACNSRHILSQ